MAQLDVSELMNDPDLTSSFEVVRRTQGNNANGVNVLTEVERCCARGYVGAAGNNALARIADYQTMGKTLEVKTKFRLRGPAQCRGTSFAPDLVVWDRDVYVVADVQDWTGFGRGFVSAVLSSQDFIDAPPGDGGAGFSS